MAWMIRWQNMPPPPVTWPVFDSAFMRIEMELFERYFLESYLKYHLNEPQRRSLHRCLALILKSIAKQPYVFMHRDFHSRNLMVDDVGTLSVIDFQGAQWGTFCCMIRHLCIMIFIPPGQESNV